ncbi:MAG TPA: S9 family peptidase, partial [Zunongwangia profunda]|nr:S9 family peptidase [Zunongwangia profunda]
MYKPMKKLMLVMSLVFSGTFVFGQKTMTPEKLWQVERISVLGLDKNGEQLFYKVSIPNMEENDYTSKYYQIPAEGG